MFHSCLAAAVLATVAHLFDSKLRANTDVPSHIRLVGFIAGAAGMLLGLAGTVTCSERRALNVLMLALAIWCTYCAAFATVFPRVNR